MPGLFEDEKLLFDPGKKITRHFPLGKEQLILREQFFEKDFADTCYSELLSQTPWHQHHRKMYDKTILDPRLTAWYAKGSPNSWTALLLSIKNRVEADCKIQFDSVLLNLYRDGQDSVSWHSDTLPASGQHQPIGSVSFGQTRAFYIRHKFDKSVKPFSIPLTHGSFLLMPASMQEDWEHHIPKINRPLSPRINLTFRITG